MALKCHQCRMVYLEAENVGSWACRCHRAPFFAGTRRYECCGLDLDRHSVERVGEAVFRGCHVADHDMGAPNTNVCVLPPDAPQLQRFVYVYSPRLAKMRPDAVLRDRVVQTVAVFTQVMSDFGARADAPAVLNSLRAAMVYDPAFYDWYTDAVERRADAERGYAIDALMLVAARVFPRIMKRHQLLPAAAADFWTTRAIANLLRGLALDADNEVNAAIKMGVVAALLDDAAMQAVVPPFYLVRRVNPVIDGDVANTLRSLCVF